MREPAPHAPGPHNVVAIARAVSSKNRTNSVPDCARGLVVAIISSSDEHARSSTSEGTRSSSSDTLSRRNQETRKASCSAFLLRDDRVLTTRACAKDATAVIVPGHGRFLVDSKAKSPCYNVVLLTLRRKENSSIPQEYVYHRNSGWPRNRMFLNTGGVAKNLGTNNDKKLEFEIACSEHGRRPILGAYYLDESGDKVNVSLLGDQEEAQDDYSLLIQDALRTGEDDNEGVTAEMSNDELRERWWVRKQTKEEFDDQLLHTRKWYVDMAHNMSETALSVAQGLGVPGVLELEDPRVGRHRRCLRWYFEHWSLRDNPFSGEPFFQWLDYGSGKHFEHPNCSHSMLDAHHIKFFNVTEQKRAMVKFNVADHGNTVRLSFATSSMPVLPGGWLFVWGTDKNMYVAKETSTVNHASLLGGEPVLHAGELEVASNDEGKLYSLNAASGHYRPKVQHVRTFFRFLTKMGMNRQAVRWEHDSKIFPEEVWNKVFE